MKPLNVRMPDELLAALDKFAARCNLSRSEAARLAIGWYVVDHKPYYPPALPNWQVEAWTSLLCGIFGDERLVLTADVKPLLEEAVAALGPRGARVLRLRFGLSGPRHTGAETAAIMGWANRQRVHQVEIEALRRMRGLLRRSGIWELLEEQLSKEEANVSETANGGHSKLHHGERARRAKP